MKFVPSVLLTVFCCSLLTTQEITLTCDPEKFTQQLDCGYGVIVVQSVAASHREAEACVDGVPPPDRRDPPLCSMSPVLNIIRRRCDSRYRCSVPMNLCHSAKP